jgi:DAACS family dicarboxylate/amino acid:cation (Na+ or H+) symporter
MNRLLPVLMLAGLLLGALFGLYLPHVAMRLLPISTVWMQAIKMMIMPLVLCAITLGMYQLGSNSQQIKRISIISLIYFLLSTVLAGALGVTISQFLHPDTGLLLHASSVPKNLATSVNWTQFFLDLVPSNLVAALAGHNLLPVVLFSILLGLSMSSFGSERAKPLADVFETLLAVIFKMIGWIVLFSPLAIFSTIGWLVASHGIATILSLAKLVGATYFGLFLMLAIFYGLLKWIGESPIRVTRQVSEPLILAFTTRSSEITLPLHMERLIEAGVPKPLVSAILPLGYAFNRDGATLYAALAVGFLAQMYHIHLTWTMLFTVALLSALSIDGAANIPSGGLVSIAVVLMAIGVPVQAVAIVAGIDAFVDMGRTAMNVFSNTVAIKLVMKFAGLKSEAGTAAYPNTLGGNLACVPQ